VGFGNVEAAYADISGLTPCSESKAFAKREKGELKTLNKRLKQVRISRPSCWRGDAGASAGHIRRPGRVPVRGSGAAARAGRGRGGGVRRPRQRCVALAAWP
jgi:hypothetical protein